MVTIITGLLVAQQAYTLDLRKEIEPMAHSPPGGFAMWSKEPSAARPKLLSPVEAFREVVWRVAGYELMC